MLLSQVLLFFLFGTFVVAVPPRGQSSIRHDGPVPVMGQPRHNARIDGYWVRRISATTPADGRYDVLYIGEARLQLYRMTNRLGVLTLKVNRLTTRRQLIRLVDVWTRMPTADIPLEYRNFMIHMEASQTGITMTLINPDVAPPGNRSRPFRLSPGTAVFG
ncbi:hypothetical protein F5887DRAFT_650905 [Amanita rubescens]|nr:hypothetical protein F5887DRAFT_650905 [Amanita rubescens]